AAIRERRKQAEAGDCRAHQRHAGPAARLADRERDSRWRNDTSSTRHMPPASVGREESAPVPVFRRILRAARDLAVKRSEPRSAPSSPPRARKTAARKTESRLLQRDAHWRSDGIRNDARGEIEEH